MRVRVPPSAHLDIEIKWLPILRGLEPFYHGAMRVAKERGLALRTAAFQRADQAELCAAAPADMMRIIKRRSHEGVHRIYRETPRR